MSRSVRLPLLLIATAAAVLGIGTLAAGGRQSRQGPDLDGWANAVVEGRARLRTAMAGKPLPITSGIMRGGMQPLEIRYNLVGQADLYLKVESAPTYDYGQSAWGEPVLVAEDGSETRLTDIKPDSVRVGWGELLVNKNVGGSAIKLAGRTMQFGYWAHADSLLHFRLTKPYREFRATAGVEDLAGTNGHVRFIVSAAAPDALADPSLTAEADRLVPELSVLSRRMLTSDLDVAGLRAEAEKTLVQMERERLARALPLIRKAGLRKALDALAARYPARYADAPALRAAVNALPTDTAPIVAALAAGDAAAVEKARGIVSLQRDILLRSPALDFDRVIAIKRGEAMMGLPANFNSNSDLPRKGYDNEVVSLSIHGRSPMATLLHPSDARFIGDLNLHWDADRFLFSMPDARDRWHVWEAGLAGGDPRQVTPDMGSDVDNYDACYLPGGGILFTSTAGMVAVPCVQGASHVATLFRLGADGVVSQLCFDQEHNWSPRVMPDGTVLYQRWEYADTPHANTRLLFSMNPDGTNQREFYGSNSYWPSAFFYAQPVPGKPTQVLGISTGHHGPARTGELVLLDVEKGRREADGAVQRIGTTQDRVKARIYDHMDNVWPNFLHPCPINDQQFLVACKPGPDYPWGIYVTDIYDNLVEIASTSGYAMLEPVAVMRRPVPPALPDRINPKRRDAVVQIQDIYRGPGLAGIPRGTVKSLRLFSYTYGYRGVGGLYGIIGMDGPWDIHRVLGTVPVRPDGSAYFRVPANTPISVQPLDGKGQALALMRSWMTARPGETLSCVGCHESQSSGPMGRVAGRRGTAPGAPDNITPWRKMVSGFSFEREVQPVLDTYCAGCHTARGAQPDLTGGKMITDWSSAFSGNGGAQAGHFSTAYANLFPFVRNNGIEGDYHVLSPMEFHFSTTELGKMLRKGHHGVQLPADAMDRLVTWADVNRPYHGSWSSIVGPGICKSEDRRAELRLKYANVDENHEKLPPMPHAAARPVVPPAAPPPPHAMVNVAGWPFSAATALARQGSAGPMALPLGNGLSVSLVRIPAGSFAMGSDAEHPDSAPRSRVTIGKAFWMARFEVTNAEYRLFRPGHDSRVADALSYQFGQRPWSLNEPGQPVCRVSWLDAMAFCRWLSARTGKHVTLPTEAQWEWACRAGSAGAYSFGPAGVDYSAFANLGDRSLSLFAADTSYNEYHGIATIANPNKYDDWIPKDSTHNDGHQLSCKPGSYRPNAWGLYDMHGNVAEWTRSLYLPYPYHEGAGNGERVVRGGSWWTRPFQATAAWRQPYAEYQPVMDVGFRIIVED